MQPGLYTLQSVLASNLLSSAVQGVDIDLQALDGWSLGVNDSSLCTVVTAEGNESAANKPRV